MGRESSFAPVWVKMHNLPLHYYNESALHRLGSLLGTVLSIHQSTSNLMQQAYAKVCIELDVSKPFKEKVWIGTSKEYGWSTDLEYEGNHAYCDYCALLGHTVGLCKKKREDNGKSKGTKGKEKMQEELEDKTNKPGSKEHWVPKKGVVSQEQIHQSEDHEKGKEGQTDEEESQRATRILTCPPRGVNEETRRALVSAGLASPLNGETSRSAKDDTLAAEDLTLSNVDKKLDQEEQNTTVIQQHIPKPNQVTFAEDIQVLNPSTALVQAGPSTLIQDTSNKNNFAV